MDSQLLDRMRILLEFGPDFLSLSEQDSRLEEQLSNYFDVLAVGSFNFRGREFWRLHQDGLDELGYSIYNRRFAKAIVAKSLDLMLNPKATTEKVVRRVKNRGHGVRPR